MTLNGISLLMFIGGYGLKCCGGAGAGASGGGPLRCDWPLLCGRVGPYGLGYVGSCCGAGASVRVVR